MTIDKNDGNIVVVRDDAVYYYGTNGRGPSFAYEGPKKLVRIFRQYVALITPPQAPPAARSTGLRAFVTRHTEDILNISTFAILDTDLKYVAHTESLTSPVKALFIEWGDIFLLTLNGKVPKVHTSCLARKVVNMS